MGQQHDRFAKFFEERRGKREPADEAALLRAADAYDRTVAAKKLSAKDLQIIVASASSPKMIQWGNAVDLLGKLAKKYPAAADAIVQMSKDKRSNVRYAAICCLIPQNDLRFSEAVLKVMIADKSGRIRWKAAQTAQELNLKTLVPQIEAAVDIESNAETRRSLEYSLQMLRDGYRLRQSSDGLWWYMTISTPGLVGATRISSEEMAERGAKAIADEWRAKQEK